VNSASHMKPWSRFGQLLCGRLLGHQDRNHSDGNTHYAYCLRCGYLFGHPWGSPNTEKGTYLGALITAYGNATFDCGAWGADEEAQEEPYKTVYERAQGAKRALLGEIARQKLGIGEVPDGRECVPPSTGVKEKR
jgi:hypothetical protein